MLQHKSIKIQSKKTIFKISINVTINPHTQHFFIDSKKKRRKKSTFRKWLQSKSAINWERKWAKGGRLKPAPFEDPGVSKLTIYILLTSRCVQGILSLSLVYTIREFRVRNENTERVKLTFITQGVNGCAESISVCASRCPGLLHAKIQCRRTIPQHSKCGLSAVRTQKIHLSTREAFPLHQQQQQQHFRRRVVPPRKRIDTRVGDWWQPPIHTHRECLLVDF